jgi:hypothetical protein
VSAKSILTDRKGLVYNCHGLMLKKEPSLRHLSPSNSLQGAGSKP